MYEELRNKSNQFTASLSVQQSKACAALRLHEVFTFIDDIKYKDECDDIENLKKVLEKAEQTKTDVQTLVNNKKSKISKL